MSRKTAASQVSVGDLVEVSPYTDADRHTLDVMGRVGEVIALHRTRATVRLHTYRGDSTEEQVRIRFVDLRLRETGR